METNVIQNDEQRLMKKAVLDRIERDDEQMRPRWYFIFRIILLFLFAAMAVLTLLFLMSFTIFVLRQNGTLFIPAFGLRGLIAFLIALPWMLVLLTIAVILVLETLTRQFAFAYRRPLLYSALGIIIVTTAGAIVVERSSFHGFISREIQAYQLPLIDQLYEEYASQRPPSVYRGIFVTSTANGFIIEDPQNATITVVMTSATQMPYGLDLTGGDYVVVFGDLASATIQAIGVRELDEDVNRNFCQLGFPHCIPVLP